MAGVCRVQPHPDESTTLSKADMRARRWRSGGRVPADRQIGVLLTSVRVRTPPSPSRRLRRRSSLHRLTCTSVRHSMPGARARLTSPGAIVGEISASVAGAMADSGPARKAPRSTAMLRQMGTEGRPPAFNQSM